MSSLAKTPLYDLCLYDYHDYREYLNAWVDLKRSAHTGFSLRGLARKLDVSAAQLTMILKGRRNLSQKLFSKLQHELKLDSREISYFKKIILLTDEKDPDVRKKALKDIQRFKLYQSLNTNEHEAYQYLNKWYYVAIKEMSGLDDFVLDPSWIKNRLHNKVSIQEIRSAITFLLDHNFIKLDQQNKIVAEDKVLRCMSGVYKLSLSSFHQQVLNLGIDSIHTIDSEDRNILGHTVSLSKSQFKKVKKILDEALSKIEKIGEADPGSDKNKEVYHVELMSFPLTQKKEE